jgi:excisionase family DNA binding protein
MINAAQMGEKLGVKVATINAWAKANTLPAFKIGRHWMFEADDVLRVIKLNGNKLQQAMGRIPR